MTEWWGMLSPEQKKVKAKQVPANKNYLDQISAHHAVPSIALAARLTEVSGELIHFSTWRSYAKAKETSKPRTQQPAYPVEASVR